MYNEESSMPTGRGMVENAGASMWGCFGCRKPCHRGVEAAKRRMEANSPATIALANYTTSLGNPELCVTLSRSTVQGGKQNAATLSLASPRLR